MITLHTFFPLEYAFPLPLMPLGIGLMTLHCIIGVVAAIVAQRRGLSFRRWIWIGLLGGTIALIAALRTPSKL